MGLLEKCKDDAFTRWNEWDQNSLEVYAFPQIWGSTALGFNGIGGSAMTSDTTVVVLSLHNERAAVYFGGRHAYDVESVRGKFVKALKEMQMPAVDKKHSLIGD